MKSLSINNFGPVQRVWTENDGAPPQSGFRNTVIKRLPAFTLTAVLIAALVYIFTSVYVSFWTVIGIILIVPMFFIYETVSKYRFFGSLIYLGFMFAVFIISGTVIASTGTDRIQNYVQLFEWFFSGGKAVETTSAYMLVYVIAFSFFISSSVYYFTAVSFRIIMLTIVSFIPCALYVKVLIPLPEAFALLIASNLLVLYIINARKETAAEAVTVGRRQAFSSLTDFAAAAVLLAFIIPKPSVTPYYEKFEGFVSRFTIGGVFTRSEGRYSQVSGNADSFLQMENVLLYMVNTDTPDYFKTQVFSHYDSQNNYWTISEDKSPGHPNWESAREKLNYTVLQEAIRAASLKNPEITEKYNLSDFLSLETDDSKRQARITTVDFPTEFFISPMRANSVILNINSNARTAYRTRDGEVFPDVDWLDRNETYSVVYYHDGFIKESGWLEAGGCDFSYAGYGNLLSDALNSLGSNEDEEHYDIIKSFISEHNNARPYLAGEFETVSPEINDLAASITDGLSYDYEKARAIENYFKTNGFLYDLAYTAPSETDTADFFLFESKRGTCSDFASAFCLLARAAGLTVRYTEGFVPMPSENGIRGVYEIYTESAHAYPEVYIPGAGWLRYEPTVANLLGRGSAGGDQNEDFTESLITYGVYAFLSAIFVVLLIIRPKIAEGIFRFKMKFKDNSTAVIMTYNRYCGNIAKYFGADTSKLTAEQVSKLAKILTFEDTDLFASLFNKAFYGGKPIGDEEKKEAMSCYKRQYVLLKARKKRDKKNRVKTDYVSMIPDIR